MASGGVSPDSHMHTLFPADRQHLLLTIPPTPTPQHRGKQLKPQRQQCTPPPLTPPASLYPSDAVWIQSTSCDIRPGGVEKPAGKTCNDDDECGVVWHAHANMENLVCHPVAWYCLCSSDLTCTAASRICWCTALSCCYSVCSCAVKRPRVGSAHYRRWHHSCRRRHTGWASPEASWVPWGQA